MRFASLLSGGKDSTLAHHLALDHGFTPVAGIVITPRADESHMFHLPNLDLARAHLEALDLDPIRVEAPEGKETELTALREAFQQAAARGAETVVTGAVASEYQRTRIEEAAHREGLKTHTPLWHKPAPRLLDELVRGGYEVRFSAVSAHGLDASWLGRRLDASAKQDLLELQQTHGVHPIGEGGEYETLVLDAPAFHKRLNVEQAQTHWERDRGRWRVTDWAWKPPRGRGKPQG